jgi:uncharacterized repeat protein (TIGR03847 family)
MSSSFELDAPDHFTAGAIGPAGQRVFYIQARQGGRLFTLKCEKEQVRALGEYLASLLARLPNVAGEPLPDHALLQPVEPAWAVRAIAAGYDADGDRVVVEAHELVEEPEESPAEPEAEAETESPAEAEGAQARFFITRVQAAAFVTRARELMAAGRPECVFCSLPIDPGGHVCPRSNGHLRH